VNETQIEPLHAGCRGGPAIIFGILAVRGWDAEAWDPVKVWTDEEWQQAREAEEYGLFAFGPDDPADAAEANAVEIEDRERELTRSDVYSQALGIAPVRTMAGVLQYMIACGVVIERTEGGTLRRTRCSSWWWIGSASPLPASVCASPSEGTTSPTKALRPSERWPAAAR
jgi:hypothetical protein